MPPLDRRTGFDILATAMDEPAGLSIVPGLPSRQNALPHTMMGRWLFQGGRLDHSDTGAATHPWHRVLWLTGVDYFSTLGYQPGIALLAAGALSPLATLILIAVTLGAALPTYAQVARRSFVGQGSIAMLENLLSGWSSKIFVLVLLGFAGTDFVITMTLSAADGARHAVENPYLLPFVGHHPVLVTAGFLALLALVFLKGFREAIGLAAFVAVPYLALNVVVLGRGVVEIWRHPSLWSTWRFDVGTHGDWTSVLLVSALVFPKLALGMSGFETGVSVMPLIDGGAKPRPAGPPVRRIHATRNLLTAAALIMSVMLLFSSVVTTLLVPPDAYARGGAASGRAIAYLAHGLMGDTFGTVYDLSTIAILWFAGASAMAGLLNLIPRYLPRFGMAPRWVAYRRPLVVVLFVIDLVVTLVFDAEVEAQGGAYATGVLVLMFSASAAVALALGREARAEGTGRARANQGFFWLVTAVFGYTLVDNVVGRPDGVIIASVFIAAILVLGAASRYRRATELRVSSLTFADEASLKIWDDIRDKKVHLIPLRTNTKAFRQRKAAEIRRHYAVSGRFAFIHVTLPDNRSEFMAPLRIRVRDVDDDLLIEVSQAVAVANTIAFVSELIDPISIFVGLTRQNAASQALKYLLFGEGEIGLMVYQILVRYWEWTPEEDVRPLIFLMSD
jgi:hypothetical protein